MVIAETLGKFYSEVNASITDEEVLMWSGYFQIKKEDQDESMKKAKRGR
jgi:hypothetical protein